MICLSRFFIAFFSIICADETADGCLGNVTYGLFGTDDDIVSCEAEYDKYYRNKMVFIGGHRLTDDVIHDYVVEAILKLLCDIQR